MKNTFIKMLSVMMAMVIALGACAITVYAEDEPAGGETGAETTHTCTLKTVNAVSDPLITCVGALKRYQQCSVCNKIVPYNNSYTVEADKDPDAHICLDDSWTITGDVENGWAKTNTCYLCGEAVSNAIPADAHDWEAAVKTAPTATDAGELVYTCKGTDECATECPATYSIVILAENGAGIDGCTHENKGEAVDSFNEPCQPSYKIYECADCSNVFVADYVSAVSHNIDRDTLRTVDATCDDAGYTYYACNNCTYEEIVAEIPAGHRVVADGDVIDNSCGNTDFPEEGVVCYMCQAHFDREAHNYAVTDDFAGDCQNAPYTIYTCDCGDTYTDPGTLDPTAHVYQTVGEPNTDVFVSNIGTKVECSVCHDTKITDYLYGDIFFSYKVKNSSNTENTEYAFVNGVHKTNNKVIIELYIHSYDADAINAMQFDFKYNSSVFELNDVTANTEVIGKKDIYYNETATGNIRVVYTASNVKNADGKFELGALALSNEPILFATVVLDIKEGCIGYDEEQVKKSVNLGDGVDMNTIIIADKEHNELYAKAQNLDPIYIYKLGDISGTIGSTTGTEGDGKINAVDLSWMLEIIANGDYTDVRADIDLSGDIDGDDLASMRDWLLGKTTYPKA